MVREPNPTPIFRYWWRTASGVIRGPGLCSALLHDDEGHLWVELEYGEEVWWIQHRAIVRAEVITKRSSINTTTTAGPSSHLNQVASALFAPGRSTKPSVPPRLKYSSGIRLFPGPTGALLPDLSHD